MLDRLIDRAGDLNPQIFRELKERLTLRNTAIAVAAALVVQVLVLSYFNGQIPIPGLANKLPGHYELYSSTASKYCDFHYFKSTADYDISPKLCRFDGSNSFKVNWQLWRSDIFECLSWILPLGLILGSVYLLVADLVREKKRGTLNFVRLSPQSAQQTFIGKILSVPILIYVAATVMLPLHLLMGLGGGRSLPLLAGWYVTIGAMWFLLSSVVVLSVLLGGMQAILTVIATAYPLYSSLTIINFYTLETINLGPKGFNAVEYIAGLLSFKNGKHAWFGLPFTNSAILFSAFVIGSCLVASYWVWQVLDRRYRNPTGTRIGRSQSYLINLCLQVWIVGLIIPDISTDDFGTLSIRYFGGFTFVGLAAIDFVALLLLIWMLLPSKQPLQNGRYRQERVIYQRHLPEQSYPVQDLVENDPNIASRAIAINIAMVLALWLPMLIIILYTIASQIGP